MGKVHVLHSIVLHAHDIGEADRFCIALTKERGRIAARAYGVRKPKSRMGGSILPLQEAMLTVREISSGWHISDCTVLHNEGNALSFTSFVQATQCADILLSLLEDDTPVPEVFHLMQQCITACRTSELASSLPFTIQLLSTLGLLPLQVDHAIFDHVEKQEKEILQKIYSEGWAGITCNATETQRLSFLCAKILDEQSRRPLKASAVAMTL